MEIKEIIKRSEALTKKSQEIIDFMDRSQKEREENYKKIMDGFNDIKNAISNIKNQNKEKWGLKK